MMTSRNRFVVLLISIWFFLMPWLPHAISRGDLAGRGYHHLKPHGSNDKKGSANSEPTNESSGSGTNTDTDTNSEFIADSHPSGDSGSNPQSDQKRPSPSRDKAITKSYHTEADTGRSRSHERRAPHQSHNSKPQALPTLSLNKDNNSVYYTNVSIGTPGQKQHLVINIVDPYNWVTSSNFETHNHISNHQSGLYDSNFSETSESEDGSRIFHLDFVDLENVNATAVMDRISFESVSLKNQSLHSLNNSQNGDSWVSYDPHSLVLSNLSFFEINDTSSQEGVLGLGGRISDQGTDIDSSQFDSSFFFLENLRDNGIIESLSYSLWFGGDTRPYYNMGRDVPDEIDCGKLILGGVDPYYYTGSLKKFHNLIFLDSKTDTLSRGYPVLPMGTINVVSSAGNSINVTNENFLTPVLLDSRYSFSHLPAEAIVQIAVQINAIYVKEIDKFVVSCKIADMGVTIQFEFGDLSINVPLTDFLMSSYNPNLNSTMRFSGGDEACFMTMVSSEETGFNILGTSFLRNIYLAVDHDDQSIAIAQARRKYTTLISPEIEDGSSAISATFNYLSPSLSSTGEAKPMASGYIPYAVSSNESLSMTLSPSQPPSRDSHIPNQFTATVFSNGLISTGRSLYNTYRLTSPSTTVPTDFASFSVTSAQRTNSAGQQGHKDSSGYRLKPPEIGIKNWISHTFSLVVIVTLLIIL